MGACAFDPETLSYSGTPVEQAMCLMRGMDATRNLGPPLQSLPPGLASRIGQTTGLPARETLSDYLSKQNLETDFAAYLWQPLSRAYDNDPDAPLARYFVIHDTSGPNYGHRAFPDDIDTDPEYVKTSPITPARMVGGALTSSSIAPAKCYWRTIIRLPGARPVRASGRIRRRAARSIPA